MPLDLSDMERLTEKFREGEGRALLEDLQARERQLLLAFLNFVAAQPKVEE